ncbi:endoglucanase [Paenibacillus anaericanus]|nr:endoglucanase [Paenibacillus anaericanus]
MSLGKLHVKGTGLYDEQGESVQLRGISSHGLQWYPHYVNMETIQWLRDDWNINVYRVAMYTGENGYIEHPDLKNKVKEAVEASIELGLYVIIDWHILSDNDPNLHKEEAMAFFAEMAQLYAGYPNIIYEICNEPNGVNVTWNDVIRPYAEELISVIRQYDKDNVILVGTGTWSQDVHHAADHPFAQDNIMYVAHFYAGTHGQELRDKIKYALDKGAAIFVSEWGTTLASGDGGVFTQESDVWLNFLNEKGISWINWNLSDRIEDSAVLLPGAASQGNWSDQDLTPSGKYVRSKLRESM